MVIDEQRFQRILNREREDFRKFTNAQFDGVRSDLGQVFEIVCGIKKDLIQLHASMAKNTEGLEFVKKELSFVHEDVNRMVSREEFADLEARVAKLERSGRASR